MSARCVLAALLSAVMVARAPDAASQPATREALAARERLRAGLAAVGQAERGGAGETKPRTRPTLRSHQATTPPVALVRVEPPHPVAAELAGDAGRLAVECVIDEQGAVRDCIVLESWPALETAALAALAKWRFTPALVDDKPRPVLKVWIWEHRRDDAAREWRPNWRFDWDRAAFRYEW
jgi:TonB family protein